MIRSTCPLCEGSRIQNMSSYPNNQLVKCRDCGLVFDNRVPTERELSNFYSQYSYGGHIYESPVTRKRYNELLDYFEQFRITNRILDDGCGTGFFLAVAKERGWEVYGTEYSSKAMEICKGRGIHMLMELDVHSFPEGYFDVITSFEVLEHLTDPAKKVDHFQRFLREGGLFYCTTPNFNSLSRRLVRGNWSIFIYPEHLFYFTRKTLARLLKNYGFNESKLITTGISISRMARILNRQAPVKGANNNDEKFRALSEKMSFLLVAKNVANKFLSIFKLGDTLKGWYIKSGNWKSR